MKEYREPEAKFISLNPAEKVAAVCWGYAANGKPSPTYYYDLEGLGSLEFVVAKGNNCNTGGPDMSCVYYVVDENGDGVISETEKTPATQAQKDILVEAMHTKWGGNSGESFESGPFSEGNIPGDWS